MSARNTVNAPGMSSAARAARNAVTAEQLRRGPGLIGGVSLVAEREIRTRLRSKSFIFSTLVILVLVVGGIVVGSLFGSGIGTALSGPDLPVAVAPGAEQATKDTGLETVAVADRAEGEKLLRDGEASAVVVPDSVSELGVTVLGLDSAPNAVIEQLAVVPGVELIDPKAQDGLVANFAAIGFGVVFMMAAMTFGTVIAQSVVEEKSTRVVEILLSSISVRALLAGKVLGNSALALGQMVLLTGAAVAALMLTGQGAVLFTFGIPVVWFIVFFAIGFVLLSALFAATASLVSRQEDVNSAVSPITMLVMIPYILVIVFSSDEQVLGAMSYVPLAATVGMPMRLLLGTAEWWEPLVSVAISLVATVLLIMLAAKIYENSQLKTGSRIPLMQALRGS